MLTELRHAFFQIKRYASVSAYGRLVNETEECRPDRAGIAVPLVGSLEATGDRLSPFRLVDPAGRPVDAVSTYLRDLQATGSSDATLRSYGLDLLRWFRFLWAIDVAWDRAMRTEARDFCRWMLLSGKPSRPHWRRRGEPHRASATGEPYSASSRAHAETVLRCFYEFHLRAGTGPLINPFPLDRSRRGGRAHAQRDAVLHQLAKAVGPTALIGVGHMDLSRDALADELQQMRLIGHVAVKRGSSLPGGFLRSTYSPPAQRRLNVGLLCPPLILGSVVCVLM